MKSGDFLSGWRPVRFARITVEHQSIGFERLFELFLTERNCLVVVVWAYCLELEAITHAPPATRTLILVRSFLPIVARSVARIGPHQINAPLQTLTMVSS